jgi:hypothetical protein
MKIDWASLGVVAIVTVVAAMLIVGIMSLGLQSLATADQRVADGQTAGPAKMIGFACIGVAGLIVLYGLYLIIPQFH